MKLSIVTINFRKPLLTLSCIESVYAMYEKQFTQNEWEMLIVDNFSQDNSVELLEKELREQKYKNVSLLLHKENNGFGGGNNFGAKSAKGEYILFLNNDTIVGKGLDGMLEFLEKHKEVGVLGGPLHSRDGSVQSSAGAFYSVWRVFLLLLGLQRFGLDKNPLTTQKVDWVKGALLMIRKELFEKLKGFDERIFMYTEDMEICYRVQSFGKEVWFFPHIEVIHEDQGSSNRSFAILQIYTGILYFFKNHKSDFEYCIVKLLLQIKAKFLVLLGKLIKNTYLVSTYEKAFDILG